MEARRGKRGMALAVAAALVAGVSCGGSGDDAASSPMSVDQGVRSGVESQLGSSATTAVAAEQPSSMDEWEALWAEERAAIVARIQENGWGKSTDGTKLSGPDGYTVDLSTCPAEWSDTEGLTDTSIKYGFPSPQSGAQADFGTMPKAAEVMLHHYGTEGAFKDSVGKTRNVEVIIRDDAYDPARTIPLVDEMLDSERVFALSSMISPGGLKTYDKVNQRCIPYLITTGHPAWGDPVNHPWVTGLIMSYSTEAVLWGSYIEQHLDEWGGKAKVAALVMSNDFGKAYEGSLRAYIDQSPRKADIELVTEAVESQAPSVKDQMTTLAAQQPDVYISMLTGTPCSQATTEAAENGMNEQVKVMFTSSVCKASSFVGRDKVGDASDGWWVVGGGKKDFNSAALDDDAFVVWTRELLKDAGYDYKTSGNYGWGAEIGWGLSQMLMIAGDLPGGLTRTNFNLAARSMDMTNPGLISGIGYNMAGGADAYLIEGSDIAQWNAAEQSWNTESIVELSGASGLCAWNAAVSACS